MRIQAFVTEWNSPTVHAKETALQLAEHVPTVLLSGVYDRPFAEQWLAAMDYFHGDVFFWVMGDVRIPYNDLRAMITRMSWILDRSNVAMYAPNVEWSSQIYNTKKMTPFEPFNDVYEVCGTDLLCCALTKELLYAAPPINGNSRAWFYDYVLAATARKRLQKKAVRDYAFKVEHPQGSIYSMEVAKRDANDWMATLPPSIYAETQHLIAKQAELCS